jgi:CHAT domain-containing protein/tetratricopeptide (TPR) repeat protein
MRHFTLPFALVLCVLALPQSGPAGQPPVPEGEKKPAAPRHLSREDARWVGKKYAEAVAFGRQGKWGHDEAQAPVREILALCTRVLGEDHFTTADYRREIEGLKKLAALPEAGRLEYMKTYRLWDEIRELYKKRRYADALRPAEQILDIYRRLLGDHAYVALAANECGYLLHYAERYADAEARYREALKVYRAAVGEDHPGVGAVYGNLAMTLEKRGRFPEARQLLEEALKVITRLRGENHASTGVAYNNLASHIDRQARYAEAEPLYRKAVKALRAWEGDDSDRLSTACNNLALNLQHQGKYDEAEPLYREALRIRLNVFGPDHPDTGRVYMNFASNREAQGHVAEAEPLYRKALENYRKGYGENATETAWAMNNLAVNLDAQGRYAEAEPLFGAALAAVRRSPSEQGWAVAKISNNLAACLREQGKHKEAAELCAGALAALRERLGPDHPDVAAVLHNVAATLETQDKHAEAEPHFREALAALKRRLGEGHPDAAVAAVNLGINLYHQSRFAEAEQLFQEALAAFRRAVGEGHPSTAWAYKSLLLNYCARGQHARAAALAAKAEQSFETARRRISFTGLERAGRTAEISPFPALAAVAARAGKPERAWRALENNLARGLLDDLAAQKLPAEDRRREQALLGRLDLLDREAAAPPKGRGEDGDRAAHEERRQRLRRLRDTAQEELARFQAQVVAKYGVPAGEVYDLARVQARLPEGAALLAWVDISDQARPTDPMGDHWACLVRRRGAPVWARVRGTGTGGAWTDEDDRLAARARRAFANRPGGAAGPWKDLARRLAEQRLGPVEGHLKATPELPAVRHLIVLPSHEMAGVPVEALAERLPKESLAHRATVSYAPSGTMFAWLQERRDRRPAPVATLLALGDPAFRQAGAGGGRAEFARLEWARQELRGVSRLNFDKVERLTGPEASEQSLERLAAGGRLGEFRYLHFATHGVLDDRRPMQSALILAPAAPGKVRDGGAARDGRLTAQQVLRGWKLDAELVTLSACNTGLGRYAGGEGHLGFSQALFLAGARGLVLSLWEVDDASTALLMTRFYENLLGEGTDKPMPKAEALAEAKRWLRGLGPAEVSQLTKDLPTRGTRGRVVPRNAPGPAPAVRSYEHPYYWSGFILIGDPR